MFLCVQELSGLSDEQTDAATPAQSRGDSQPVSDEEDMVDDALSEKGKNSATVAAYSTLSHCIAAVVSPDHVDELAGVLIEIASSWDLFLGQLGIENYKRKSIQLNNANKPDFPEHCLLQGLHHWVLSDASPTYDRVARALRGDMIANKPLAVKVKQFAIEKFSAKVNITSIRLQC